MKKIIFIAIAFLVFIPKGYAQEIAEETKFFKTTISGDGKYFYTTEVSEEEYNNVTEEVLTRSYVETQYKKLSITKTSSYANLTVEWKVLPSCRSFDVIAIRGEGVTFTASSLSGEQLYVKNNTSDIVNYTYTSNNTKIFSTGAGISMNLVDDATSYTLKLRIIYNKTGNNPKIFGSYQHTQTNLTLSQSKNYTLSSSGYGKVINFASSVKSYYDNMPGVSLSL